MRAFQPSSYEEWLSELKFQNDFDGIVKVANNISKLAVDKKRAQIDVSLVLADKYLSDLKRANNAMVRRVIEQDFDKISNHLFRCNIGALVKFAQKHEPDITRPGIGDAPTAKGPALGFVQSDSTVDEEGRVRTPLGFVKKPLSKDDKGNIRPSLGFLD